MGGILEGVNQRTQLVGENRLELLLFTLGGRQRFGINVFKVREVIPCPPIVRHPNASRSVRGISNIRGKTISMIDLGLALGRPPMGDTKDCFVIVTEFNRTIQGFLVRGVERILNINWSEVLPPPKGMDKTGYMTAVTKIDNELVEIIDVEKVLAELVGITIDVSEEATLSSDEARELRILVADDSLVARKQVKSTLDKVGLSCDLAKNGREALEMLKQAVAEGKPISDTYDVVISDIEMPEMDGYTLTTEIRADERLRGLPVMLHTSLSGTFNSSMVKKAGADKFVAKFNAQELSQELHNLLQERGLIGASEQLKAG